MFKKGQTYKALKEISAICLTTWKKPYTGGSDVVLPAGELFIIAVDPPLEATAVCCDPINYDDLEKKFVSKGERKARKYTGYYLCVDMNDIDSSCELIST